MRKNYDTIQKSADIYTTGVVVRVLHRNNDKVTTQHSLVQVITYYNRGTQNLSTTSIIKSNAQNQLICSLTQQNKKRPQIKIKIAIIIIMFNYYILY